MRAITLQQPVPWALCYAECDVINMPRPAPDGERCWGCEWYRANFGRDPIDCGECFGTMRRPLRVLIHAGQQWGKINGASCGLPDDHTPTHRAFIDHRPGGGINDVVSGYPLDPEDSPAVGQQPFGAIVAVATILDSHIAGTIIGPSHVPPFDCCESPWATMPETGYPELHHWRVGDIQPLPEPIPCRGHSGLWKPSPETKKAVEVQLKVASHE